jgi:cation diffusion facilitator CzcD-associated flavoprotein CzcO
VTRVVAVGRRPAEYLRDAGLTDVEVLDRAVTRSVFDEDTNTWALTTADGQTCRGRVIVAEPPLEPWIPAIAGRDEFGGTAFHAATPDPGFAPAGRRIAVIGADAGAGRFLERTARSATSVTVFALPPRRVVSVSRNRWRRSTSPDVVAAPIDRVTVSGVHTGDGARYDVDAIVYGTGFALTDGGETLVGAGGLTLRQAWRLGMEPYLGIAVHGFPNYFLIGAASPKDQARDIAACVALMTRAGGSRIALRRSSQHVFNERVHLRGPRHRPSAFDVSTAAAGDDNVYDGAATLTTGDTRRRVRVRLTGHVDPIDGQYHWQGTIFDHLPDDVRNAKAVTLAVGERTAPARITERTPQRTHSITGVGAPPFAPDDARPC